MCDNKQLLKSPIISYQILPPGMFVVPDIPQIVLHHWYVCMYACVCGLYHFKPQMHITTK